MKLGIKPTVDLIFKAIFGDERHAGITKSFLNDILVEIGRPKAASLEILNPFRPGHFNSDRGIVLDVRALDEGGREFQIEMQMRSFSGLPQRMLHGDLTIVTIELEAWAILIRRRVEYPAACCSLVTKGGGIRSLIQCNSLQNQQHRSSP